MLCTIFIHSLIRIRKLTRSLRSLVRFLILHNSWIKIVRAHFPWSNLYIQPSRNWKLGAEFLCLIPADYPTLSLCVNCVQCSDQVHLCQSLWPSLWTGRRWRHQRNRLKGLVYSLALLIRFQQLVMRRRKGLIEIKSQLRAWKVRVSKGQWVGEADSCPKNFENIRRRTHHS